MTAMTKFNCLGLDVAEKKHDWSTDVLKVMLTNTLPVAATAVAPSDITEISAVNGYSAGGMTCAFTSFTQTGGVGKLVLVNSAMLTASGGNVGPFRWAVLYNATASRLIGFADYGSSLTLADTQQFQVQFNGTTGAIQIT